MSIPLKKSALDSDRASISFGLTAYAGLRFHCTTLLKAPENNAYWRTLLLQRFDRHTPLPAGIFIIGQGGGPCQTLCGGSRSFPRKMLRETGDRREQNHKLRLWSSHAERRVRQKRQRPGRGLGRSPTSVLEYPKRIFQYIAGLFTNRSEVKKQKIFKVFNFFCFFNSFLLKGKLIFAFDLL